jgi:hypothetical protein
MKTSETYKLSLPHSLIQRLTVIHVQPLLIQSIAGIRVVYKTLRNGVVLQLMQPKIVIKIFRKVYIAKMPQDKIFLISTICITPTVKQFQLLYVVGLMS